MNKRYDSLELTRFIRHAIAQKGGDSQHEILQNVLNGENFVSWIDGKIALGKGDEEILFPPESVRLGAGEYVDFPLTTALMYYSAWENLPLSDAASPSFWAYVTRQAIANGKLAPYNLVLSTADSCPNDNTGKDKIEEAFKLSDAKRNKAMDGLVRNFIRNLCGISEVRGARSIYQDCPFARSWWQCHIAHSVSQSVSSNDWNNTILPILREKPVWEQMSDKMASRLTVIGDINIRNGIILHLHEQEKGQRDKTNVKNLLSRIGVMCAWRALGYFSSEDVKKIVGGVSELLFSENSNGGAQTN